MSGSSPLAWGILIEFVSSTGRLRFILTRVGYTWDIAWIFSHTAVHPHSRGVYVKSDGLIVTLSTVHPHSRGVYISISFMKFFFFGSSPLAWGIHFYCFLLHYVGQGSSPLAWGIPKTATESALTNAVHPHSRGVYFSPGHFLASVCRFIPTRVGYTDYDTVVLPVVFRFIPTRVGYTRPPMRSAHNSSVHPHSRGVYLSGSYPMALSPSVHPHSRGVYLSCKL